MRFLINVNKKRLVLGEFFLQSYKEFSARFHKINVSLYADQSWIPLWYFHNIYILCKQSLGWLFLI